MRRTTRVTMWVPWLAMFLSAALTYLCLKSLAQRDLSLPPGGDVRASLILLVAAVLGTAWRPVWALDILLGLYVPFYLFAALGWVGNAILPYLTLAFGLTLVAKTLAKDITSVFPVKRFGPGLPGTFLILLLTLFSFAQWFRSADMRDSANRLFDIAALGLLLLELPKWDGESLREATQAFVLGATGSSLVLLNAELFKTDRLGKLLQFNPDFIGYLAGGALLLVMSKMVFRASRWVPFAIVPVLATALYFSGCRGAFYGALLTIPLVLWYERRFVGLSAVACLGAAGAYSMFQGMNNPDGLAFRMMEPFMERFADASSRRDQIWKLLWDQRDQYWLTGIGLDNATKLTGGGGLSAHGFALATHNVYFTFFVDLGIVGLALFLAWHFWILSFGIEHRATMVLLSPLAIYYGIEGFFSGFGNIAFLAFALAVGFRLRLRVSGPAAVKTRRQQAYIRQNQISMIERFSDAR